MASQPRPALVIMAAGMGSRFGGDKQVTPVGADGEWLMDYSIYDALRAGFGRIVLIIKPEHESVFRAHLDGRVEVTYVYQQLDRLPAGYTVPEGRVKPWGTGHAVLCCHGTVTEPFAVINADDYYGPTGFRLLAEFLSRPQTDDRYHIAMAGYMLANTLTENGYVSRGVCQVDREGCLTEIVERVHIERRGDGAAYTEDGGETWVPLAADTTVSMDCWAFPSGALDRFEQNFRRFLDTLPDPNKSEFYLPAVVDAMRIDGEADVTVMSTPDRWYGMTYAEDRPRVIAAIGDLTAQGVYPRPLFA